MPAPFKLKPYLVVWLLVSLWVNASEVFRYFVIVMPETRSFLAMVPNIAPMNWSVFAVWGAWDMLLTGCVVLIFWLVAQAFGNTLRSVLVAGLLAWALFFLLFWVAMCNMSLAPVSLALKALPLALLEMLVACFIASRLYASSFIASLDRSS